MSYDSTKIKQIAVAVTLLQAPLFSPNLSAQENPTQWDCQAVDGEWLCQREESSRRPYNLPPDPTRVGADIDPTQARLNQRSALDWVPKAALTEEQQAACPKGCNGAYVQPDRDTDDAEVDPRLAEIRAEAGSSYIDALSRQATMDGDVVFSQGWRNVSADHVIVNREKSEYSLEGNVSIREPGLLVVGDSASVKGEDNSLNVQNATYLLHDSRLRGSASELRREGESQFVIDDASYTSCEPGDEAWIMNTDELSINEETGRVSGRNVVIRTAGVPVFYVPYISFPYDDRRQTGLLYPSLKASAQDGLDYEQPIFWNLADNQDITFTPRFIENRGVSLGLEHRYLSETTFTTSSGSYSPEDTSGGRNRLYDDEARWLLNLGHQGYIKGLWTELSLARVSDVDYFEDYGSSVVDEASASNLTQYGAIGYQQGSWQFNLLAENFQTLVIANADQYLRLPELEIKGLGQMGAGFWWQLDYQFSRFDHSRDEVEGALGFQRASDDTWVTGERLRSDVKLGWRTESDWFYFEPTLGVDALYYRLDNPLANQTLKNPSEVAPSVSLDFGIALERTANIFGSQWIHTLEPQLFYLHKDAGDQNDLPVFDTTVATRGYDQLFRRNSFVGGDRLSDNDQVTLGVSSSLYSFDTGEELGRFRLAQAYYFEDRTVHLSPEILAGLTEPESMDASDPLFVAANVGAETLNELSYDRSEIIATLDLNLSANWSISNEVLWDEEASSLDRTQISLGYRHPEKNRQVDIRYFREKDVVYLRDRNGDGFSTFDELLQENVEQASITGVMDWRENWSFVARLQRDFSSQRSVDAVFGLSYHNCCWNVSATWRRWLERDGSNGTLTEDLSHDSGIFLGFEWVGLGGIGQSPSEILRRGRIQ